MVETETKVQRYRSYKDSGIEWLGVIPEHWDIESFKNILTERNEKNAPIRTKEILSLSIDKGVTLYAEKTTNLDRFKDDFTKYKLAHKGDLVFNSMNMIVGAVGVSDYFGCVSPVYYTYHGSNKSNTTKFYEYLFRCKTIQGVLYSLGKGLMAIDRGDGKYNTLRLKVSRDDLRSMKLPLPNFSEQTLIVEFLDNKTTKIDEAITIKEQQISLLKERKQILIHKAVTRGLDENVELKDSGEEWIGEIPVHWELKRFKFLATSNKGKLPNKIESINDDNLPPYMSMDYLRGGEGNQWVKDKDAFIIDENEILLLWDGSNSGEFLKSRKGVISSTVAHIIFSNINKDFAWYHSMVLEIELRKNTIGMGIPHVNGRVLNNLAMLLPPFSEQKEIVDYLDDGTKKIETAISLKQQEIEKLKEYKNSLINSVVTGKVKVC